MHIGTAKPNAEELAAAEHYFINNLSIHDHYTAGMFEKDAMALLEQLFQIHDIVILVGGSTLYIHALLHGIDAMPEVSDPAKQQVKNMYEQGGIEALRMQLQLLDPIYCTQADLNNTRRMMRALEVCISSAKPYSSFLKNQGKPRVFDSIKLCLDLPREQLYERINQRCDQMLKQGLLEEVKTLFPYRHHTPLHTVGYSEFFNFLEGKCSYEEAVIKFKQHSRNYAKRQLTWFRREPDLTWGTAEELSRVVEHLL